MKVLLAKPRGFCAGVDRAVDIVELALVTYGKPVYMRHEIVHNPFVVRQLEAKGAIFVEATTDIPEGSVAIFSAHGVSPAVWDEARTRNLRIIDATCPLVKKVHFEAKRFGEKGGTIVLIGHKGHVEVEGTSGEAPGHTVLIETADEAEKLGLADPANTIILTQTTLSVDDTSEIIHVLKRRFPAIQLPPKEDICYATTNRQLAVKELSKQCEVIIAVGAPQSSNTNRLKEVAEREGCRAYLIQQADELRPEWFEGVQTVGVTAGASAPESIVQEVIAWLMEHGATSAQEVEVIQETMKFTLPPELLEQAKKNGKSVLVEKHTIVR
ncbi:MAG: 4-hydroxy-3-methylbut-2-enyl diphosphate reductase [Candidatus Kerfeldbacteria bacterium]|nr:4-hydroxy-3-methylbut-2-enyl diphosphate reductase [Candidatus Kerfeldbacteria bacterium]